MLRPTDAPTHSSPPETRAACGDTAAQLLHLLLTQPPVSKGTRDELAMLELLQPVVQRLGARATLKLLQDADHSFHVRASSGRRDPDVRQELILALVDWIDGLPA